MSTISDAKRILEAELAFLTARAEKVVSAINALSAVDGQPAKPVAQPVAKKAEKPAKVEVKKVETKAASSELPDTGGDWFFSLFTDKPQPRAELVAAALKKAGGSKLSKDAQRKLMARMDFAMRDLVKKERVVVKDTEAGKVFTRK